MLFQSGELRSLRNDGGQDVRAPRAVFLEFVTGNDVEDFCGRKITPFQLSPAFPIRIA